MAGTIQLRQSAGAPGGIGGQFRAGLKRRDLPSLSFMDLGWAANIASQIVVDVASGVILSKLPLHRKKRKKQKEEREVKIERYNLYRARRKTKKEKLGD